MNQPDLATSEAHSSATYAAQAVLVLGMHRSGTSALARVLNLMGVELGSDLLPPAQDNEAGFWEHRQIQFIHDRIYEALNLDWTNVSPLPANWWERAEIEPYRQQLREVLRSDFGKRRLWGVKDPRLCAMMPLWRPLLVELNVQPRCVLICRNPVEVAQSLAKRDGMSMARVHLLWMRSTIESERGSRGLPRSITTFEQVLGDWRGQMSHIERSLDLRFPRSCDDVADAVAEFIRPSLRHHQVTDEQLLNKPEIPGEVRRLYSAVLHAISSGDLTELSHAVDAVAEELEHAHPLLSNCIHDLEQVHRNTVIEKNREQIRLDAEVAAQHKSAMANAAYAADREKHFVTLQQQLIEQVALMEAERQQAAREREIAAQDRAAYAQQIALAQTHVAELQRQLAASRTETSDWQKHAAIVRESLTMHANQLNAERANAESVKSELSQYQIQRMILLRVLEQMQQTRPWRYTAGFRKQAVTRAMLLPVSPMRSVGEFRWACDGVAHLALPCLPMRGRIRIELKLSVSVPGHARLYFDTGKLFNPGEVVDLGPVDGEVTIEREVAIALPVHCFRLDPLDRSGEFTISYLRIVCISAR